jgi:hypothetical protein
VKQKRNREKLMEQSMYDLLMHMNQWLKKNTHCVCVMECFMQTQDVETRCSNDCEKCLQSWMNEYPF